MTCLSKADKVQKKKELRRNLRKLRNLVDSDTNNATTILSDALHCISTTKQQIEERSREIETMNNMQHFEHHPRSFEVKVEEQGVNQFRLNVTSANEEGKNYLAIIIRALEEKEISFINANMSRCFGFEMEAVIEVTQAMDSSVLTETVIQAIENNGGSK